MSDSNPKTVFRKDYRPYTHTVEHVDLDFQLDPDSTRVTSLLTVRPAEGASSHDLVLDGEDIELESLLLDGRPASEGTEYRRTPRGLVVCGVRRETKITVVSRFSPSANTALSGIYMTTTGFMSQCEAEGFRRITFWPDRPDVMSRFTVTIHADREKYPVLLSNGNLVGQGEEEDGRHWARWEDPFRKPCYLFALVAGDLQARTCTHRLADGRDVQLEIWTDAQNQPRSAWALESLKKAIAWDEKRWGLELDLDRFMVVATDDFNFGAMENKGLNIFNSRYVMASPAVAADEDYENILTVIGHEYFHNWTGDRVTLRDWFQLTLKEGLTTFREQEFGADMAPGKDGRALRRIAAVRRLRQAQFPEDAGPMAHPIRPESYEEIDNFYTMTVYEKGAEVIRMLQALFGVEGFRKGFDLYISRFDGRAATCDDFLACMAEANGADLREFGRWYFQAGTPRVTVRTRWDSGERALRVTLSQSTPPAPGAPAREPFTIPVRIGLVDRRTGEDLAFTADPLNPPSREPGLLVLTDVEQTWTFRGLESEPVLSVNRGFSAPVILDFPRPSADLAFLALNDSDPFCRSEAMRALSLELLHAVTDALECGREPEMRPEWLSVFSAVLRDASLSPALRAVLLELPSEDEIGQTRPLIQPEAIHAAVEFVRSETGRRLSSMLARTVEENAPQGPFSPDAESAGRRALRALALSYWLHGGSAQALLAARELNRTADNLTDRLAALRMIVASRSPAKADVLTQAFEQWRREPLLVNKWFTLQATASTEPGEQPVVQRVRSLMQWEAFQIANPNNVYALVGAFVRSNPAEFHRADGSGYEFWKQAVLELDRVNPSTAGRIARALDGWRRYSPDRARLMHRALSDVAAEKNLSPAVREIVQKALSNH